jgi:Leucine-rich repeat (LRR) protein
MKRNTTIIFALAMSLALLMPFTSNAQKKKGPEPGSYFSLKDAMKADPKSVIKLDLSKQGLKEFPVEVFNFVNLQQLNLSNNKISSLPENIADLKNLSFLDVSKNKLTALPRGIGNFKNLNSFKMSQNKISELPEEFFKITSLEIIDFYSNPLKIEPKKFAALEKRLKYIDVRNTGLTESDCKLLQQILPNVRLKFDKGCNCHS